MGRGWEMDQRIGRRWIELEDKVRRKRRSEEKSIRYNINKYM